MFGPELSQKVTHRAGVSRHSLGEEEHGLPMENGMKTSDFLKFPCASKEVARVEGIWLLKVVWVMEGRTQDGIHGNAVRGC